MKEIIMPSEVSYVLDEIEKNGFESYIVGGCVRDSIMGKRPKDWDITTNATPEDIIKIFPKTFETGIEHGTVTVVVNKNNIEVTTYRIDGDYKDNRRPEEVCFTKSLEEDLKRRDFTMNAIAYNKTYVDIFGGITDIKNKTIKGVGNPNVRFEEDALRMLRCIRFSASTGFEIEKNTYEAIFNKRHLLKNISVERIREEFTKLLIGEENSKIDLLIKTKLIKYYDENFYYYLKNYKDLTTNLKKSPKELWALLCVVFLETDISKKYMKQLKFDNNTIFD